MIDEEGERKGSDLLIEAQRGIYVQGQLGAEAMRSERSGTIRG